MIKIGKIDYLNVHSTADLFHFMQDFGKLAGMQIGRILSRTQKQLKKEGLEEADKLILESQQNQHLGIHKKYREQIEHINKTVHPYNENNELQDVEIIKKALTRSLVNVGHIAGELDIEISTPRSIKIIKQIPDIVGGVESWKNWLNESLEKLLGKQEKEIQESLRVWMTSYLMPFAYWQINLPKTQSRKKNRRLREYYKGRVDESQKAYAENNFTKQLNKKQEQQYMDWALDMARKFQRSSSSVEGRNGYLSFVNHANKGIPSSRLEALTVVHNYDIQDIFGQSKAEKLFKRGFPDLFEFILENVTRLPEPRNRKISC